MIKGAILDMDGTVLDSMHLWMNIGPRVLEKFGVKTDIDIQEATKNMLFEEMNVWFKEQGLLDVTVEELAAKANSMVEQGYLEEVLVKPGVVEFLDKLKERNIPIVLATATDIHLVTAALKRNGIFKYFDKIYTCYDFRCDKKTTIIYDASREFLGTPKDQTYIFEDTLTPIKTLAPTEYKVVGVADKWSAHNEEKIRQLADLFVYNLNEIDLDTL
ncbi:MAG: HAD family phosphatase [Clostridia bacterium]|nr:HAD family phosphatase [Clostridia bacterium]MBR5991330.1 HAD family phosphatase [Clostridia bacterium]